MTGILRLVMVGFTLVAMALMWVAASASSSVIIVGLPFAAAKAIGVTP